MSTSKEGFITINRDGFPPIRFKMAPDCYWCGSSWSSTSARWTEVHIYKTIGGKYIAEVENRTQSQGERGFTKAEVFTTPAEVIAYLKGDEERLGRVSQEAVSDACRSDPEFAKAFVVEVD